MQYQYGTMQNPAGADFEIRRLAHQRFSIPEIYIASMGVWSIMRAEHQNGITWFDVVEPVKKKKSWGRIFTPNFIVTITVIGGIIYTIVSVTVALCVK